MAKPNTAIDLTTMDAVLRSISTSGPKPSEAEQQNIQDCITSASSYWLWRTGQGDDSGNPASGSPFVKVQGYDEIYDGNGAPRMFLKHRPIRSVTLLKVGNQIIPQSTAYGVPGWVIDQERKSIAIRGSGGGASPAYTTTSFGGGCGQWFVQGIQNIQVQYTAGYDFVPYDIEEKVREQVILNYKRRAWVDQRSQAMAQGAGTVTFRDWEFPPGIASVMMAYSRVVPV